MVQQAHSYFQSRISEMGLTHQQAWDHGIQEGKNGDIQILIRDFSGGAIRHKARIPVFDAKGTPVLDPYGKQKTIPGQALPAYVRRLHPDNINPAKPGYKYAWPTALSTIPIPTNLAIESFKNRKGGGSGYATEGYFKALVGCTHSLEFIAYNGIPNFRIDNQHTRDYFAERAFDDYTILFDGDAREIRRDGNTGRYSNKRVNDFYRSAKQFAEQWFADGYTGKLYFAVVSDSQPHKGFDDLLLASPDKSKVIVSLESHRTSEFFTFLELKKSRYDKNLKELFRVSSHVEFYTAHQAKIGFEPFIFDGVTYQRIIPEKGKNLFGQERQGMVFAILDNPYNFELKSTTVRVKKYLSERKDAILRTIEDNYKTYLEAPTGSGKTHLVFKHLPGRTVLAVPTLNLADQISREYNVPKIIGGMEVRDRHKALQAKKIVCVYDMLPAITDLHSRSLVIDEAHNLVSAYGYRDPAIRYIAQQVANELPEKVVLLSGTPDLLLSKAWDCSLIQVTREVNNTVLINPVTSQKNSPKSLQKAVIGKLEGINWDSDKTNWIFWDSDTQLNKLRDYCIKYFGIRPDQIAFFTSDKTKNGDASAYDNLIGSGKLPGIKLVLTTRLTAEGINVKSENLGKILTVNLFDPALARQFYARFRNVQNLEVWDIKPPKISITAGWVPDAWERYESKKKGVASEEKGLLEREGDTRLSELEPEELEYLSEIEPGYIYASDFLRHTYTSEGKAYIDDLKILHGIRESIRQSSNNTFFYSQLVLHPGLIINEASTECTASAEVSERMDGITAEQKNTATALQSELIELLSHSPQIAVTALYRHYKVRQDRKGSSTIVKRAPDLIQEGASAESYRLGAGKAVFESKALTGLILNYIRMHAIKLPPDAIARELSEYSEKRFLEKWRAYRYQMESGIFKNRNWRKHLKIDHRLDLRAFEAIKHILDTTPPKTLSEARKTINSKLKIKYIDATGIKYNKLQPLTDNEVLSILKKLYRVSLKSAFIKNETTENKKHKSTVLATWTSKGVKIKAGREQVIHLEPHADLFQGNTLSAPDYIKLFL